MSVTNSAVIPCQACGARNRVSVGRDGARCGACKEPLPAFSALPVPCTDATFAREVLGADLPVLLDLWAPWCGPCQMLTPLIEATAGRYAGRLKVVKLDTQANPLTAQKLNVTGIPTLIIFRAGQPVARQTGAPGAAQLEAWLQAAGIH
jgi:thioredoxin 2